MGLTFYIGFMACGKSTLGQKHAAASGKNFVDLDREFSRETGMTPENTLQKKARRLSAGKKTAQESSGPLDGIRKTGQLVACGGGTPVSLTTWSL